jgi:hypothetical protein
VLRIVRESRRSNGRDHVHALRVDVSTARTLDCYRSLGAPAPEVA